MSGEVATRAAGGPGPADWGITAQQLPAPAARSATGLRIFNRARHFHDLLAARRQLEAAEKAAIASSNDYGLVDGVVVRSRDDDDRIVAVPTSERRRRDASHLPGDS